MAGGVRGRQEQSASLLDCFYVIVYLAQSFLACSM
jgi:hypothetical protein